MGRRLRPLSCGHWAVASFHTKKQSSLLDLGLDTTSAPLCSFSLGGAPCSLHLSGRFPPTLTASPALDHEEPRTEDKPFSSSNVALMRSLGDVGASEAQGQEQVGPSGVTTCTSAWPCHSKGLASGSPFPSQGPRSQLCKSTTAHCPSRADLPLRRRLLGCD